MASKISEFSTLKDMKRHAKDFGPSFSLSTMAMIAAENACRANYRDEALEFMAFAKDILTTIAPVQDRELVRNVVSPSLARADKPRRARR